MSVKAIKGSIVGIGGRIPLVNRYLMARIESDQRKLFFNESEQLRRSNKAPSRIKDQQSRWRTAEIIAELCDDESTILEFGAGYGHNIEIISQLVDAHFVAIEPGDAILSLPERVPKTEVIQGDDSLLQTDQISSVDVSFTRGVLILLLPKTAKAVVAKLCSVSRQIVITENLSYVDGSYSRVSAGQYIAHPYRKWLSASGFEIKRIEKLPSMEFGGASILVAERRGPDG